MAHYDHDQVLPYKAASVIGQGVVAAMPIASPINETVVPAPSAGFAGTLVGITIATVPSTGDEVAIVYTGVAKARAAASLGAGVRVGPASLNGALGPIAAGSPGLKYVGYAKTSAAAGEYFACVLDPGQIV